MKVLDELKGVPVVIVSGTGGVGKTTTSCGLAISLAQQFDAKVLVITIDPAKRLASVLSESSLDHQPKKIDHQKFIADSELKGELFAAMVDTSQGWRDIVERYAKSERDAERIFSNNLYSNLTTRFSHSHDFVAMDALYEHYRSGTYDYIVLDTPPTSQAFGFFDAPQAMSEFFGGRLVKLITSPYRFGNGRAAKLFDLASQPFFALADKVLGKDFLNDIGEFFFLFHTMYDDIVERATSITNFLTSEKVHSCLVADSSQYISNSYDQMAKGLYDRNIDLSFVLINGVPFDLEKDSEIIALLEGHSNQQSNQLIVAMNRDLKTSILLREEIETRLKGHRELRESPQIPVAVVPRVLELEIVPRIAELANIIQNLSLIDDTI